MAVVSGPVLAILTVIKYADAIVGEAWTRYLLILAGLTINNAVGIFTGFFVIESLLSFVISGVFGVQGFYFPAPYGVSTLLIIVAMAPMCFFSFKMAASLATGNQ